MPIMRAPSGSEKTVKIPCSGEGIFVSANMMINDGAGSVAYWNGTSMKLMGYDVYCKIQSITVQNGVATVIISNDIGSYDEYTRVCFIPGDPLASN